MPRDLELDQAGEKSKSPPTPITLTESPNRMPSGSPSPKQSIETSNSPSPDTKREFVIISADQHFQHSQAPSNLHPYVRPLTINDLKSCVALENAAFAEGERASREKIIYRLTKCGELGLGIFCTVDPKSGFQAATLATGRPVETSRENGAVSVLLGHVISVKAVSPTVTDEAMDYPRDWDAEHPTPSDLGHQERGRTIALHSVAILPGFQGRGLGQVLVRSYMQHMNGAGIADRLALLAHDDKVAWYEKLGFTSKGKSHATFGGGGWFDMIYELKTLELRTRYGS